MRPEGAEAFERRAEALHAAGKIKARLQGMRAMDAVVLAGLYTERVFTRRVRKVLGELAGAFEATAIVRAEHMRALARARTKTTKVGDWLDELARDGDSRLVEWRGEVEAVCAAAIRAYEEVRGAGPSVVPREDGEG
jgi:hypothetical protein